MVVLLALRPLVLEAVPVVSAPRLQLPKVLTQALALAPRSFDVSDMSVLVEL